jgi:DNA-binding transcriptional LysR family regulator
LECLSYLHKLFYTVLSAHRLRLLAELHRRGSVSAVADALHFTPSAVSQQLALLERETGTPLVERVGRGVVLTDQGRALAAHGERVVEALEAAEGELASGRGLSGSVRVAAFQTAARYLAAPALEALQARHPERTVALIEADAEETLPILAVGELDVAVAEEYEHAPRARDRRMTRFDLTTDALRVAISRDHRLGGSTRPLRLAALAGEPWAYYPGTAYGEMFLHACRAIGGFEPELRHRVSDMQTLLELAARNLGVAIVPMLGSPQEDPRVVIRPVAGTRLTRAIYAVVRGSQVDRPANQAVIAAMRAAA